MLRTPFLPQFFDVKFTENVLVLYRKIVDDLNFEGQSNNVNKLIHGFNHNFTLGNEFTDLSTSVSLG